MNLSRVVTVLIWLALAATFFIPVEASWIDWCQIAFWILAATHLVEFLVYLPMLRKHGGSLVGHFFQVLLFGYIYYKEIKSVEAR